MSDFGYIVLWSTWHPSARTTRIENSESCISPCYQGWSEYIVIWFCFGFLSRVFSITVFYLFIQVVIHTIRLPKQSTVGDVLNDLKTKVIVHEYYLVHQHLNCTLTLNWNHNYNQRELMASFAFKTKDTWSHVCRFCSVLHLVIEVVNF